MYWNRFLARLGGFYAQDTQQQGCVGIVRIFCSLYGQHCGLQLIAVRETPSNNALVLLVNYLSVGLWLVFLYTKSSAPQLQSSQSQSTVSASPALMEFGLISPWSPSLLA